MAKDQEASKSKVIAVRLPDDEARRIEARAEAKGLTKSEYLASLVRRDLADALKISDDLARRIEARAYERGETRAEYLTKLIKADLERPHDHHLHADDKPHTSWLSFFSRGHTRHRKRQYGKRDAEPQPTLAQLAIKGFQPVLDELRNDGLLPEGHQTLAQMIDQGQKDDLADPAADQGKKPEEGPDQAQGSAAPVRRRRSRRRPGRDNVQATTSQPHSSVAVRAEPVPRA